MKKYKIRIHKRKSNSKNTNRTSLQTFNSIQIIELKTTSNTFKKSITISLKIQKGQTEESDNDKDVKQNN